MNDIDILDELFKKSIRIKLSKHYDKKMKAELKEQNYPSSSVSVVGIPCNSMIIKADGFSSPYSVFAGIKGECKRADFIIIADESSKKCIVYIEIKASKGINKEIIQQLTGAQCFMAYCKEIGQKFWENPSFLMKYQEYFVSLCRTSINKKKDSI